MWLGWSRAHLSTVPHLRGPRRSLGILNGWSTIVGPDGRGTIRNSSSGLEPLVCTAADARACAGTRSPDQAGGLVHGLMPVAHYVTRGQMPEHWALLRQFPPITEGGKKRIRHGESERTNRAISNSPPEEDPDELDLKEILLNVKTSLKTIDGKLDLLTARLDQVKQHVDTQESRMDNLENRISDIVDQQTESKEKLLKMNRILDIIKAKNEDIEARSHRSSLRIAGAPETNVISKMED
ncbi:hypothetical protein NDU88_002584 [Pleurodeles waltl]|uniref:Uncharacterized protein n=1 Tax=Pleurodeles waltl TaxID=8319 RepID=A0AAV7KSI5_PLEWA|nr:hypothetical protein NDU88_002584 [Pleurodeles waltl]